MDRVASFVNKALPNYLQRVVIPANIEAASKLTSDQWINLLPVVIFLAVLIYIPVRLLTSALSSSPKEKKSRINTSIKLNEAKVADTVQFDGKKAVLCRCWKSKNFPYCDGSHNKYNETSGDNVGPVIVTPKAD